MSLDDVAALADIAGRAFESERVRAQVESTLRLYCTSGIAGLSLMNQPKEALPREFFTVVAVRGDEPRIAGVTGIYRLGTWTWPGNIWLAWTAIDPALQRLGIGRASLRAMMGLARIRGAERLKVETEYEGVSVAFYLSAGFEREARLISHYGPASDALVLSRDLADVDSADDSDTVIDLSAEPRPFTHS